MSSSSWRARAQAWAVVPVGVLGAKASVSRLARHDGHTSRTTRPEFQGNSPQWRACTALCPSEPRGPVMEEARCRWLACGRERQLRTIGRWSRDSSSRATRWCSESSMQLHPKHPTACKQQPDQWLTVWDTWGTRVVQAPCARPPMSRANPLAGSRYGQPAREQSLGLARMPCAALRRRADAHTLVQVTWEELAEHNTPQDLWVAIRGKVYDLTTYQNRHPGGFRLMQLGAGRDVTHLFEAYHPLRCDQEHAETLPSSSFSYLARGWPDPAAGSTVAVRALTGAEGR